MQLFRVTRNMTMAGESYRVGEEIEIDPDHPAWAKYVPILEPVKPQPQPKVESVNTELTAPTSSEVVSDSLDAT